MDSTHQQTGDDSCASVESRPEDGGVTSLADIEEHSQFVQEYMRRLLQENSSSTSADPSPSAPAPAHQNQSSASASSSEGGYRDTTNAGDVTTAPNRQSEPDSRSRRPPADPHEEREMLSRMRRVANESTTSTLAEYDLMIGRATLLKTTVAMFLLAASFALFAIASSGRLSLFFPGAACWLAALFFSLPLFRRLMSN